MSELHTDAPYEEWAEYNRAQMARDRDRFTGVVESWPLPSVEHVWTPKDWMLAETGMRAQRDSLVASGCPEPVARRVTEMAWFKGADAALAELCEAMA